MSKITTNWKVFVKSVTKPQKKCIWENCFYIGEHIGILYTSTFYLTLELCISNTGNSKTCRADYNGPCTNFKYQSQNIQMENTQGDTSVLNSVKTHKPACFPYGRKGGWNCKHTVVTSNRMFRIYSVEIKLHNLSTYKGNKPD